MACLDFSGNQIGKLQSAGELGCLSVPWKKLKFVFLTFNHDVASASTIVSNQNLCYNLFYSIRCIKAFTTSFIIISTAAPNSLSYNSQV